MSVGSGGVAYENKVLSVIKPEISVLPNITIKQGTSTAAYASMEPDLQLVLFNRPFNIEIKKDDGAQMGGGSFNYDIKTKTFFMSDKTHMDKVVEQKIINVLNAKSKDLEKALDFAKQNEMSLLSKDIKGLPLRASKDVWEQMVKARLLVPLNGKVETDIDFLYDHYEHKNCFYIQIGKAGFFYLKSNPLNLPIPQLKSKFVVELRLARSGSSYVAMYKTNIASGNMRAQGRLGGANKSNYSLDQAGDLTKLFGTLNKKQITEA
jgi:hypothetical protein